VEIHFKFVGINDGNYFSFAIKLKKFKSLMSRSSSTSKQFEAFHLNFAPFFVLASFRLLQPPFPASAASLHVRVVLVLGI
jgi:hypothetical protein